MTSSIMNSKQKVGLPWLEQGTSVLSGLRSSQLSYRPRAAFRRQISGQLESEKQVTTRAGAETRQWDKEHR